MSSLHIPKRISLCRTDVQSRAKTRLLKLGLRQLLNKAYESTAADTP